MPSLSYNSPYFNAWIKPWNLTSWTLRNKKTKIISNQEFNHINDPISDNLKSIQKLAYDSPAQPIPFKTLRIISSNITRLSDEQLSKISYSYSKGSFSEPSFLDLLCDEVLHRLNRLSAYNLLRFLQSFSSILLFNESKSNLLSSELLNILTHQLLRDLKNINCVNLAQLISILDLSNLLNDDIIKKLNQSLHFKLKYASKPDYFIYPVTSLALNGSISLKNITLALKQSRRLIGPLLSYNTNPTSISDDIALVNTHLLPLKLLDYILRFDLPSLYQSLDSNCTSFLSLIQTKLLKLNYSYGDPGFISYDIRKAINRCDYDFISHIQGPYLLDLCDPIDRVIVEWDKPWSLYKNSWNSIYYSKWIKMRRRHLGLLDYRIIEIPVNDKSSRMN